jgi:hypothetical protein
VVHLIDTDLSCAMGIPEFEFAAIHHGYEVIVANQKLAIP